MKLEIDFIPESDDQWSLLRFRQEGLKGFVLPLAYLPELIQALESPVSTDVLYFWMNYGVHNTKTSCTLSISTSEHPLLQISAGQRGKLVQHLKTNYAAAL